MVEYKSQEAWVEVLLLSDLGRDNRGEADESMGSDVRRAGPLFSLPTLLHLLILQMSYPVARM